MIGAIIGDIVGSTYEFHNTRDYNFELFPEGSSYTDDTICTIAIADSIIRGIPYRENLIDWCRRYPHPMGAYGVSFSRWLNSPNPMPYDSFGNGAAMRVSPCGWGFLNLFEVKENAEGSAICSHNHPEGLRGARVIAESINILINPHSFEKVIDLVRKEYGDDWEKWIPQAGQWDETCMGCVPLAIHHLIHSESFEDAIRKAVSYGGDSDTMGAIVGSLAEAYFGIPEWMKEKALSYLPQEMIDVVSRFRMEFVNNRF